ncbi:MAG: hydrolase, partial [Acidobacteriota bacterium]|nr:hydrolase [Acidobacteriota bacterium]
LLGFRAERNDVDLEEGKFFTQIFDARADINFSPNVSWANRVQYDSSSRVLGFQTRFRWIIQPGSDLFLILNRGWEKSPDQRYVSVFDRGTAKLQYTFRF